MNTQGPSGVDPASGPNSQVNGGGQQNPSSEQSANEKLEEQVFNAIIQSVMMDLVMEAVQEES